MEAAGDRFYAARDGFVAAPVRTVQDVLAKARAARKLDEECADVLVTKILEQLAAITPAMLAG